MSATATVERAEIDGLHRELEALRAEVGRLRAAILAPKPGAARLFSPEETARLRGQVAPFLSDWERPEMDVYDQDGEPD